MDAIPSHTFVDDLLLDNCKQRKRRMPLSLFNVTVFPIILDRS